MTCTGELVPEQVLREFFSLDEDEAMHDSPISVCDGEWRRIDENTWTFWQHQDDDGAKP